MINKNTISQLRCLFWYFLFVFIYANPKGDHDDEVSGVVAVEGGGSTGAALEAARSRVDAADGAGGPCPRTASGGQEEAGHRHALASGTPYSQQGTGQGTGGYFVLYLVVWLSFGLRLGYCCVVRVLYGMIL